jgi:Ni/Co efflux regulator RcnB
MKTTHAYVALVVALLSAGQAMAQPYGRGENRGREKQEDRQERRINEQQRYDRQRYARNTPQRWEQRGVGPNHSYYRGDRMPIQYRSYQYVVEDWRGHGLRVPPRGYHWVQSGNDYVLVAIATGLILELLLNR